MKSLINLFKRIFSIFITKSNTALDQLESKIENAETKIREMKESNDGHVKGLSKLESLSISHGKKSEKFKQESEKYTQNALSLKERYQLSTDEKEKEELMNFITLALNKSENLQIESEKFLKMKEDQDKGIVILTAKVKKFRDSIKSGEDQLKILKSQKEASDVNKSVSKELSNFDFSGIDSQLSGIEEEIEADNTEAESWMKLDDSMKSDEQRMEELLSESSPSQDSKMFKDFMSK